ncbi:ARABIDOPSIS THALIANA NUDIX HYDROLASE HOMOLOG 14, nudix hydrolase homolog 14 [Hibiscus trionum]|uniref:ARABIDOPSIS THALIANA NUDIX HYDROLASE HOMOLOG 14, nudix hydrolase homolog 14 n=1 Tax=Hibiscus trionum TaxID=183268 RepID=A0A9W7MDG1_HIBTR|nr:ARABIDOPSIS THALIANA NUDIX HYDROLASE HOMOLOG 14, nudix hydrolase homolog 14 [Hibiscus trionum]
MATLLRSLMPISAFNLPKRHVVSFSLAQLLHRRSTPIPFCSRMSATSSTSLTHSISLPSQLGQPVQIVAAPGLSDSEFRVAIESSLFRQWLKNLESENGILANQGMTLTQVLIQGVDMFGKRIGFLKFKADIIDKGTGQKVPGIVFARGPAVAVLILLESEGTTYAVLTEQARVPTGRVVLELPAGMLDDDNGDFVGTAVREVEEEIGIHLKLEDMVDLTLFLDPSTGFKVFPSPGGCDEELALFLYRGHVDKNIITQLEGKETGLSEHGELIKVRVVPYEKLWRTTPDAKALMAIAIYEMAKKEGLLPQ